MSAACNSPAGSCFKVTRKLDFGGNKAHDRRSDSVRIKSADASLVAPDGGDAGSRPVNFNGLYVIKARPNIATDRKRGQRPLGSGLSLPYDQDSNGNGIDITLKGLLDDYWRYCNGQTFVSNDFGAVSHFAVPDLRGLFIRGVAGDRQGNGGNPDRDKSLTPRPDLALQGNEGNRPGSYQDWATAIPRGDNGFKASISSHPFSSTKGYQAGVANALSFGSGGTTFGNTGGDTETRPETFLVHWYCRFQSSPSGSKPGEEIPLGAILLAGTIEELSCWQTCQGQTLLINEYAPIFMIIGTAFGGDGKTSFCLPDLRGRILRGAGAADIVYPRPRGAPDAKAGATQANSTGAPRAGFALTLANWPSPPDLPFRIHFVGERVGALLPKCALSRISRQALRPSLIASAGVGPGSNTSSPMALMTALNSWTRPAIWISSLKPSDGSISNRASRFDLDDGLLCKPLAG